MNTKLGKIERMNEMEIIKETIINGNEQLRNTLILGGIFLVLSVIYILIAREDIHPPLIFTSIFMVLVCSITFIIISFKEEHTIYEAVITDFSQVEDSSYKIIRKKYGNTGYWKEAIRYKLDKDKQKDDIYIIEKIDEYDDVD